MLNCPSGLDYNQLAILFCAWAGLNRRNIEYHVTQRPGVSISTTIADLLVTEDKPKRFIEKLTAGNLAGILRRDPEAAITALQECITRVRKYRKFTIQAATSDINNLKTAAAEDIQDPGIHKDIKFALNVLEPDLEIAQKYFKHADECRAHAKNNAEISKLISLRTSTENILEPTRFAISDSDMKTELLQTIDDALAKRIAEEANRYARINDLTFYESNREKLDNLIRAVDRGCKSGAVDPLKRALLTLQRSRDELTKGKQDEVLIVKLQGYKVSDPLETLRLASKDLEAMQPAAEQTKALIQDKIAAIQAEIATIEESIVRWDNKTGDACTAAAAHSIRNEINDCKHRFIDSPEAATILGLMGRCSTIEKVFRTVEELLRIDPNSPQDAGAYRQRLSQTMAANSSELSTQQLKVIETGIGRIDALVAEKTRTAIDWLKEMMALVESATEPLKALAKLDKIPAFLPEEDREDVEHIRATLRERADSNEVEALERRFVALSRARQIECLERLKRAINGE